MNDRAMELSEKIFVLAGEINRFRRDLGDKADPVNLRDIVDRLDKSGWEMRGLADRLEKMGLTKE